MSIEVTWDEQSENVLLYRFSGVWDWPDFTRAIERSIELAQTLNGQRYDVIGCFLASSRVPAGAGISYVYSAFKRKPANCGVTVVVTRSAFVRSLVEILGRVYPETRRAFTVASTLEEARALIARVRETPSEPA